MSENHASVIGTDVQKSCLPHWAVHVYNFISLYLCSPIAQSSHYYTSLLYLFIVGLLIQGLTEQS